MLISVAERAPAAARPIQQIFIIPDGYSMYEIRPHRHNQAKDGWRG